MSFHDLEENILGELATYPLSIGPLQYVLNNRKYGDGLIVELGTGQGRTARYISANIGTRILYTFDSFYGCPIRWRHGYEKGYGSRNGHPPQGLSKNVMIRAGYFKDTLKNFVIRHKGEKIALLHVDCDIYESTKEALTTLSSMIHSGTTIVFGAFVNYIGYEHHEYRAFLEFLMGTKKKFMTIGMYGNPKDFCTIGAAQNNPQIQKAAFCIWNKDQKLPDKGTFYIDQNLSEPPEEIPAMLTQPILQSQTGRQVLQAQSSQAAMTPQLENQDRLEALPSLNLKVLPGVSVNRGLTDSPVTPFGPASRSPTVSSQVQRMPNVSSVPPIEIGVVSSHMSSPHMSSPHMTSPHMSSPHMSNPHERLMSPRRTLSISMLPPTSPVHQNIGRANSMPIIQQNSAVELRSQYKVELIVNFSNVTYFSCLWPYIRREMHIFDKVWVWANSKSERALMYLREKMEEAAVPGHAHKAEMCWPDKRTGTPDGFYPAYKKFSNPHTLYIKIDDSVVWIMDGAFQSLVNFCLQRRQKYCVFSANVINSGPIDAEHQSWEASLDTPLRFNRENPYKNLLTAEGATQVHQSLMMSLEKGELMDYLTDYIYLSGEKWELKCIAWFSNIFNENDRAKLQKGDQKYITSKLSSAKGGRYPVVVGAALMANYILRGQEKNKKSTATIKKVKTGYDADKKIINRYIEWANYLGN